MQLTGSQIVIECLKEQGVDTVFGYPGGAILNIYDELYRHHMNRELPMRQTDMHAQPEKLVSVWRQAVRELQTL